MADTNVKLPSELTRWLTNLTNAESVMRDDDSRRTSVYAAVIPTRSAETMLTVLQNHYSRSVHTLVAVYAAELTVISSCSGRKTLADAIRYVSKNSGDRRLLAHLHTMRAASALMDYIRAKLAMYETISYGDV